jgi:hypothetical protein
MPPMHPKTWRRGCGWGDKQCHRWHQSLYVQKGHARTKSPPKPAAPEESQCPVYPLHLPSRASLRIHLLCIPSPRANPCPPAEPQPAGGARGSGRLGQGSGLTENQWELEGHPEGTVSPSGTCRDGICGPDLAWGPLPSCQSWLTSAAGAMPHMPQLPF